MLKKIVVLMLVLLGICIFLPAATAAGGEIVYVPANGCYWGIYETTVHSGQEVVIGHGWISGTPGTVRMYIQALHQEFWLNASPLFTSEEEPKQYWGPIVPDTGPTDPRMNPHLPVSQAHWEYSLGQLGVGDYVLRTLLLVDHPITDVVDYDGDGHPDLFKSWTMDCTEQIHVVNP